MFIYFSIVDRRNNKQNPVSWRTLCGSRVVVISVVQLLEVKGAFGARLRELEGTRVGVGWSRGGLLRAFERRSTHGRGSCPEIDAAQFVNIRPRSARRFPGAAPGGASGPGV